MHLIYLLARVYPYWALAMAIVLMQIAIFYRRRKNKAQWTLAGIAGFLVLGIFVWFIFRGDLNSDRWIRSVFGS